jgi:hypothetical protein
MPDDRQLVIRRSRSVSNCMTGYHQAISRRRYTIATCLDGGVTPLGVELYGGRLVLLTKRGHAVGRFDLHIFRHEDLATVHRQHHSVHRDR